MNISLSEEEIAHMQFLLVQNKEQGPEWARELNRRIYDKTVRKIGKHYW